MGSPTQQDSRAQDLQEQLDIIASLCSGAPTDPVRDCLRKYDPVKKSWQIEKAFKTANKQVLVDTLAYLGVPDMDKYRSDALPHELLCRVQNLFPDICHLCKDKFCVKLSDRPILSCAKCGQGCHNKCVIALLGRNEDDMDEENGIGPEALNPYASIGFVYLCGYCQKDVIPQKEDLLVKNKATKDISSSSSLPTDQSGASSANDQSNSINNDAVDQNSATVSVENTSQTTQSLNSRTDEQDITVLPQNHRNVQQSHAQNGLEQISRPKNVARASVTRQICKFYKESRCRHGISGKRDGTCPFEHPKACQKFISNGTQASRGCKKGAACTLFHPKMCFSSLKDKTCSREECKFLHIKGTQRGSTSVDPTNEPHVLPQPARTIQKNAVGQRNQPSTQIAASNTQSHIAQTQQTPFLDQLKAMQDQMAIITSKLQQMDANYGSLLQQSLLVANRAQPYPTPMAFYPQTALYPQQYPRLAQQQQHQPPQTSQ